jgi:PAS domain S-box-containing protein
METPTKILVVEDDQGFNTLMQKALQRAGFQTEGVSKGSDAIARIGKIKADLMLLDYILPDMTGEEVVLRLVDQKVNVSFIIVTGHGDEKIAVKMMKLGARDYVIKTSGFMDVLPQVVEKTLAVLDKEQKLERAEEALRESEEKLRVIFDSAIDGILVTDTESKSFLTANRAICRMLGYSCEELTSLGINDIHPGKELPYVIDQFERQVRKEFALARNIPLKKKDGTVFYADINSAPATLAGRTYMIGMFRDISERLQARDEMEGRIRELENFYEMAVGREIKMKELKEEVQRLRQENEWLKKARECSREINYFTSAEANTQFSQNEGIKTVL